MGPAALPVKVIHDALSSGEYGMIGAGSSGLGEAVDAVYERLHSHLAATPAALAAPV